VHDVTFRRLGGESPTELAKLATLLTRRGAREVEGDADAMITFIAGGDLVPTTTLIDRLGFADRRRAFVIGLAGGLDTRQVPQPGTLGGFVELYRPLGVMETSSIRTWRSHKPGFIGEKRVAARLGCGFAKARQTPNYAHWLNGPGASAAEFVLAVLGAALQAPGA
jgi:hypothetical protein